MAEKLSIPGDISQEHFCISLIEGAVKHFGRIDVLANNAGIVFTLTKRIVKADQESKATTRNL
jgi:NAD(P)-dependent dehydrogenase (short-subunit alcohol dehydrogenase family)